MICLSCTCWRVLFSLCTYLCITLLFYTCCASCLLRIKLLGIIFVVRDAFVVRFVVVTVAVVIAV